MCVDWWSGLEETRINIQKKAQIIIYPLLLYGDGCVGVFQNRAVYSYGGKINSVSWALVQPKS